jgi:hypothetical protein
MKLTFHSYREAHIALLNADRDRVRALHRALPDQDKLDRMSDAAYDRAYDRARQHPDVQAADKAYSEISRYIKDHFPEAERRANRRLARKMGF